jgi:hypothetical protein
MSTTVEVAEFLAQTFEENGRLSHHEAVAEIKSRFGMHHLYINGNGNPAISKAVLKKFKELTHGKAKWTNRRGRGYWYRDTSIVERPTAGEEGDSCNSFS